MRCQFRRSSRATSRARPAGYRHQRRWLHRYQYCISGAHVGETRIATLLKSARDRRLQSPLKPYRRGKPAGSAHQAATYMDMPLRDDNPGRAAPVQQKGADGRMPGVPFRFAGHSPAARLVPSVLTSVREISTGLPSTAGRTSAHFASCPFGPAVTVCSAAYCPAAAALFADGMAEAAAHNPCADRWI